MVDAESQRFVNCDAQTCLSNEGTLASASPFQCFSVHSNQYFNDANIYEITVEIKLSRQHTLCKFSDKIWMHSDVQFFRGTCIYIILTRVGTSVFWDKV